jgi:uncharacterized repeat protein (TIGR01451 family)
MRTYFLLIIQIGLSFSLSGQINLSNGLRAQYDFSGNALDGTGNGFDGTVNGATLTTDRFGNPNSAYFFNGINQNIEVLGFQNMIPNQDISVSVWIKADQVKVQSIMMLTPDIISDRFDLSVYFRHNGVSSTFWDYGSIYANGRLGSVGTFFQPVWEHYVFISSSTQNLMQVYKGGYLILSKFGSSQIVNKNKPLHIGGSIGDNGTVNHFFNGSIDDIRIYDRVLNPAEVMALNHGYYESNVKDLRVFITNWPNPRPGFQEELFVICQNVGTTTVNGYVELNFDTNYTFLSANSTPDSVNTGTSYLGWNLINIPSGGQKIFSCLMSLPANIPLGTPLSSSAVIYPVVGDTVPVDNYYTLNQTVVNGYDPNDLLVNPEGDVFPSFVNNGNYLTYTIRFQNVGNASAINIRIENQLESDFYISSFEVLGASHNFTFNITNSNLLKVYFNSINLPDSAANPMGSNGFFMYRIKPLPWLTIGDQLTNNASIFFDFNAPIQTNTVVTNIVAPVHVVQAGEQMQFPLFAFPNPFTHEIAIQFESEKTDLIKVTLSDIQGKELIAKTYFINEGINRLAVPTHALLQGIYFLKVSTGQKSYYQKLVKAKAD